MIARNKQIARDRKGARFKQGFTLVESVIAIVILGIAMVSLTSFLFPQVQDSARSHYEVRAAALASSLMTEVFARGYDNNSDFDGGVERCGEGTRVCSGTYGPDGSNEINAGVRYPQNFNDVDDYIGCWTTNTASETYCNNRVGSLEDILGNSISSEYPNFAADIDVVAATVTGKSNYKKITITVTAGRYGEYSFSAYRGNY